MTGKVVSTPYTVLTLTAESTNGYIIHNNAAYKLGKQIFCQPRYVKPQSMDASEYTFVTHVNANGQGVIYIRKAGDQTVKPPDGTEFDLSILIV